jgi:hypothetical protein
VDGQYAVVPLRLYEGRPLAGAVGQFGQLPLVEAVATPAVAPVAKPVAVKPPAKPARKPRPTTSAKAAAAAL